MDEGHRHLTVTFLGNILYQPLKEILPALPRPPFLVGLSGTFDHMLFLPERHPNVVALHADLQEEYARLNSYHKTLVKWLKEHGQNPFERREELLCHVTLCRKPFDYKEWRKAFKPLPMMLTHLHLYESVGDLNYLPIWSHPIPPPFVEIDHTADIGFVIRGETLQHLYRNAKTALAFKFQSLLPYFKEQRSVDNLDDIIMALNDHVAAADAAEGSPLKAISFHGEIKTNPDKIMEWEMIVDV